MRGLERGCVRVRAAGHVERRGRGGLLELGRDAEGAVHAAWEATSASLQVFALGRRRCEALGDIHFKLNLPFVWNTDVQISFSRLALAFECCYSDLVAMYDLY